MPGARHDRCGRQDGCRCAEQCQRLRRALVARARVERRANYCERAKDYTVVLRRKDGGLQCPVCGSHGVTRQSLAGPTRCREIAWCSACRNPIEVMR